VSVSRAQENLEKWLLFSADIESFEWLDYCHNGALNLQLLAERAGISRTAIYKNALVKTAVLELAEELLENRVIDKLPYGSKGGEGASESAINKAPSTLYYEKHEQELNQLKSELKQLKDTNAQLQAEVKDQRVRLMRFQALDDVLRSRGTLPR